MTPSLILPQNAPAASSACLVDFALIDGSVVLVPSSCCTLEVVFEVDSGPGESNGFVERRAFPCISLSDASVGVVTGRVENLGTFWTHAIELADEASLGLNESAGRLEVVSVFFVMSSPSSAECCNMLAFTFFAM